MRYFLNIVFLLCVIPAAHSQGLIISAGQIVVKSGANVVIASNGNWTNNATAVCETGSWVRFTGNARQSILGTSYTTFSNVDVNNSTPGDGVWVGRDIGINGTLQMTTGHLNLWNSITTFGTAATLTGEAETRRVRATTAVLDDGLGTGTIQTTRTSPTGNEAGLGLYFTPGAALGSTVLIRGHERQQGSGNFTGNYSVFRYYRLQPTTMTTLTVNNFYYWHAELNSHTEANLQMFQRVNNGGPIYWEPRTSTVFPASDYVTSTTVNNSVTGEIIRITLGSTSTPLPVSLLSFSGTCDGNNVQVNWQTVSEINSYYYTIWRSDNGSNYYIIGNVSAAGYSGGLLEYSFNDDNPVSGIAYYRLTQTDNDMTVNMLKDIAVTCKEQNYNEDFTVFPGSDNIIVGIQGVPGKIYRLKFTNILGQTFYSEQHRSDDQTVTFTIDKSRFAMGMYFVTLDAPDFKKTKQIVISEK